VFLSFFLKIILIVPDPGFKFYLSTSLVADGGG